MNKGEKMIDKFKILIGFIFMFAFIGFFTTVFTISGIVSFNMPINEISISSNDIDVIDYYFKEYNCNFIGNNGEYYYCFVNKDCLGEYCKSNSIPLKELNHSNNN